MESIVDPLTDTREFTITGPESNKLLVDVIGPDRMSPVFAKATLGANAAAPVWIRLGLHATALPVESATGASGVFLAHDGIIPGLGEVNSNAGSPLAHGAPGAGLRLECGNPGGAKIKVIVAWRISRDGE
jgi:hypothetical protein